MLYLSEKDIADVVSLEGLMDSVEKAFRIYEEKSFEMPDRIHLHRGEDTILYMPCFMKSLFGTKILSVFPENAKKQVPVIQGVMLLNDAETGEPVSLIDGAALTAFRTGAVGGVGVRHTTRPECTKLGLVGTGTQGYYQLLFAAQARPITDIYLFNRNIGKVAPFAERVQAALPQVKIHISETIETLVEKSEIILTATTSNEPVLPDDNELLKGKHIVAIGSFKPDMRELPETLFRQVKNVYVDTEFAMEESGDLVIPLKEGWITKDQVQTFGSLLEDSSKEGWMPAEETTLFKSVGMALFDLVVSEYILNRAIEKGLGQKIGQ